MRVVFWGTYESEYDRNRILMRGLRLAGVEVFEIHSPVLERDFEKTALLKKPWSLVKLAMSFLRAYRSLAWRYIKAPEHDILFVGYLGYLDVFWAWPLAKIRGKPLVFDAFISLFDTLVNDRKIFSALSLPGQLFRYFDKLACALPDLVLLDTQAHVDFFARTYGLPREKFFRVWAGADERYYTRSCIRPGAPLKEGFRVFHYSKFAPLHGIEFILRAAKLLEAHRDIEFCLVGSGQIDETLQAEIERLELQGLKRFTWLEPEALVELIEESDVLLGVFGLSDKAQRVIPNKVYQSMALGKAIITGDGPGPRELLVNRKNAMLCPSGDAQAIAARILELKDNDALRKALGTQAYEDFHTVGTPLRIGKLLRDEFTRRFFRQVTSSPN